MNAIKRIAIQLLIFFANSNRFLLEAAVAAPPGGYDFCSGQKFFQDMKSFNSRNHQYPKELRNLPELLNPIGYCLLLVINYQGVDIPDLRIPVVFLRIKFMTYVDNCYLTDHIITCSEKSEMDPFKIPMSRAINYTDMSLKSRWTCSVLVNLFYPEDWRYEPTSYNKFFEFLWRGYVSYGVESFHEDIVFGENTEKTFLQQPLFPYQKVTVPSFVLHILTNSSARVNINTVKSDALFSLSDTDIDKFIPYTFHMLAITSAISGDIHSLKIDLLFVLPVYYNSTGVSIRWTKHHKAGFLKQITSLKLLRNENQIHAKNIPTNILSDLHMKITDSKTLYSMLRPSSHSHSSFNAYNVEFELIKSVFPNYTIGTTAEKDSSWLLRRYDTKLIIYATETNSQLSLTREIEYFSFVSCGNPSATGFNFLSFLSAYDIGSWLLAFLLLLSVGVITSLINKRTVYYYSFRYVVSMFLDQGVNEISHANQKVPLYWLYGTCSLMAMILTNAYKGDNITSLVAPFKPIPYENVSQLLDQNFTLSSKITVHIVRSRHGVSSHAFPEVFIIVMSVLNLETRNLSSGLNSKMRRLKHYIEYAGSIDVEEKADVPKSLTSQIISILNRCDKVAYLGWNNNFIEAFHALQAEGAHSSKLFLGKDIISTRTKGWVLYQWEEYGALIRVKSLETSGINNRWKTLLEFSNKLHVYSTVTKKVDAEPSQSISGNMSTIFILYISCMALCLTVGTVELSLHHLPRSTNLLCFQMRFKFNRIFHPIHAIRRACFNILW